MRHALLRLHDNMSSLRLSVPRDRLFTVNLSSRYRWYIRPLQVILVVIAVAFWLVMAWDLREASDMRKEIDMMAATLARVQEQDRALLASVGRQGMDLSESAIQLLPKEVAFANQLIAKRAFSWTRFLSELERSIPPRIAVNSIKLEPGNAVVRLTGSAVNLEDVTALTVTLQDHPHFQDPVLGQHRDAGNGMVEFDLTLRYKSQSS